MTEIYIYIARNMPVPGFKKRLKVNPKDNFQKILAEASSKLGIEAKILYSSEGAQIEDAKDLKDGEIIYISQGEKFRMGSFVLTSKQKTIKIGMVGCGVDGKTALTVRFIQNTFIDERKSTCEDAFKKVLKVYNEYVTVSVLDMPLFDTSELATMHQSLFKSCEGLVIVYAINERSSFEQLTSLQDLWVHTVQNMRKPILLVGNKLDMESERAISKAEGKGFADKIGADFIETSAKLDTNVDNAFELIAKKVYERKYNIEPEGNTCKSCTVF